jgi:hypothetical protein
MFQKNTTFGGSQKSEYLNRKLLVQITREIYGGIKIINRIKLRTLNTEP